MAAKVRKEIAENAIKFVFLEFCDLHGIQRGRVLSSGRFMDNSSEGFAMNGTQLFRLPMSDVPKMPELPLSVEAKSLRFLPDFQTFRVIPWMKGVASVIVDPCDVEGKLLPYSSRQVARNQIVRMMEYGLQILSSLEYEFTAFDAKTFAPIHRDSTGHWINSFVDEWDYLRKIYTSLTGMGIKVEQVDKEGNENIYEVPIKPSRGILAGDQGYWVKKTIREVSQQHGILASFSSKPFLQSHSVAGHFNHSVTSLSSGKPLFYDSNQPNNMSETMQHWLAGLIHHAPAMVVFACPTASCQRRFYFRLTTRHPNWGIDNRSCSFRVKNDSPGGTYIENRMFGAGCNPYLAFAVNIAAGLDGIVNKLPLPARVIGDARSRENVVPGAHWFSGRLADAVEAFENDTVIREAIGEDFVKIYLNAKKHECLLEQEALDSRDGKFYDGEYFPFL